MKDNFFRKEKTKKSNKLKSNKLFIFYCDKRTNHIMGFESYTLYNTLITPFCNIYNLITFL